MDKRRNKIGLAPDKPRISNEELSEFTIINVLAIILMISSSIIFSVLYFISDIKTAGIGYIAFKGIMFFYFIIKGHSFKVK